MTTITFDTLKYANKLKEAGVPTKQAEAEAEALAEAMSEAVKASELATKNDLHDMEMRIVKWVIALALAQMGLLVGIIMKMH